MWRVLDYSPFSVLPFLGGAWFGRNVVFVECGLGTRAFLACVDLFKMLLAHASLGFNVGAHLCLDKVRVAAEASRVAAYHIDQIVFVSVFGLPTGVIVDRVCTLKAAEKVLVFFSNAGELLDALLAVEGVGAGSADELDLRGVEVAGLNVDGQHFVQQNPILVLNFLVLVEQHLLFFAFLFQVIRYSWRAVVQR